MAGAKPKGKPKPKALAAGAKPKGKPKPKALAAGAAHGKGRKGMGGAGKQGERRRHGPRLPTALRRELDALGPRPARGSDEEEEEGAESDSGGVDVYEYEEGVPEEEAGKNGRYDAVAKYEYEFDSDDSNADENVPSDEGDDMEEDDDGEDEDEEKQIRILQETTGMPREAFDVGKKKKQPLELPLQPGDGDGPVTIHDLLDNIQGRPGYSKLRKRLQQQEKKPMVVQPPLPKVEREKLERGVVYQQSRKEVTKWEPLVKRNREAPTLYFENDVNLGVNTVGAIASEFKPRTEFEKKMAEIIYSAEMIEAHKNDGAKILELNKIDVEDVRERQNRLAKMRSLLFRHEMKAKRVKKIKSRTYHRMLKKDKLKASSADLEADPEAAKDYAMKQEFKRAEERMTLKHKNTSQWAKRILKRGLDVQDEGTRAAIAAQLQQNALLTRKMNSVKDDSSSSDESSDDDDDDESEAKLLNKGKEKILKVLGEDNEIPQSGVFSLPFMERAMKKHEEATYEEARLALEEYDESLRKLEDDNTEENGDSKKVTGKRTFGPVKNTHEETNKRPKLHDTDKNSDSEYDSDSAQHLHNNEVNKKADGVQLGTALLDDEPENGLFKSFNDIIKNPGPKTTFEVGMLVDNSWKKVKSSKGNDNSNSNTNRSKVQIPSVADPNPKQPDHNSDSDSEEDMVEGFLTMSDTKESYELPSQADLIRQAFAGDDVEAEFEKDKMEVLNDENPEPEKPALIPGWGQWTHIQQKKGLPSWMVKEHEDAKRKREDALKRRKDAKLKHVTISEHVDKKAEKLLARNLPFPYTSKDVYEQSIQIMIREEQIIDTGVSPHVYDTGGDERAWHGHTILSQRGIEEACNQNHGEPMTRCSAIGSSVTAVSLHSGPTVQSMQAPQISQYASPMQMPECAVESSAGAPSHGPPKQHGAAVSVGDWNSNNQQVPNLANGATDKAVSGNGGCLPSQGLSANDQSTSAWDDSAPRPSKGEKERRKKNYDPDVFFKVNGKLYQKLGKIGSGGSSEVHKVISAECTIYALKKIKLRGRDYPTAYGFCQEIEYLNKLKGKSNIIQLIDYEVPVTSRISVICQQKMKLDTTCAEYLY